MFQQRILPDRAIPPLPYHLKSKIEYYNTEHLEVVQPIVPFQRPICKATRCIMPYCHPCNRPADHTFINHPCSRKVPSCESVAFTNIITRIKRLFGLTSEKYLMRECDIAQVGTSGKMKLLSQNRNSHPAPRSPWLLHEVSDNCAAISGDKFARVFLELLHSL